MTLVDLTFLQFQVLSLIDADRHKDVTFEEVKKALQAGRLFDWLNTRFHGEVDTSLYRDAQIKEVTDALNEAAGGLAGRERKKMGIENSGLCLLAGLINEVIQQQQWQPRPR